MYKSHRLLLVIELLLCSIVIVFLVELCLAPPRASGTVVGVWLPPAMGATN